MIQTQWKLEKKIAEESLSAFDKVNDRRKKTEKLNKVVECKVTGINLMRNAAIKEIFLSRNLYTP